LRLTFEARALNYIKGCFHEHWPFVASGCPFFICPISPKNNFHLSAAKGQLFLKPIKFIFNNVAASRCNERLSPFGCMTELPFLLRIRGFDDLKN
jgi:hypothetical protein